MNALLLACVLAAALVLWTWIGYPLAVRGLARLSPRPLQRRPGPAPRVTVLIPAHDEEAVLAAKLENVLAQTLPGGLEVVVLSDGSTDGTRGIARDHADRGVRLISLRRRRGKAQALNLAMPLVRGEIVVVTDAPEMLVPGSLARLVAPFADPRVGAVSGRCVQLARKDAVGRATGAYWSRESALREAESRTGMVLAFEGPLAAFRREAYDPPSPGTVLDDDAIPLRIAMAGWRVVYEPGAVVFEEPTPGPAFELIRRRRYQAGAWRLIGEHLGALHPRRGMLAFQFLGHRVARTLEPWARLFLLAACATRFETPVYAAAFLLQAAVYGAGLLGWSLEARGVRAPRLGLPLLLVIQTVAAVQGVVDILAGRDCHRWRPARRKGGWRGAGTRSARIREDRICAEPR